MSGVFDPCSSSEFSRLIEDFCFLDSSLARAFPPFNPPLRPISATYFDIGLVGAELALGDSSVESPGKFPSRDPYTKQVLSAQANILVVKDCRLQPNSRRSSSR